MSKVHTSSSAYLKKSSSISTWQVVGIKKSVIKMIFVGILASILNIMACKNILIVRIESEEIFVLLQTV